MQEIKRKGSRSKREWHDLRRQNDSGDVLLGGRVEALLGSGTELAGGREGIEEVPRLVLRRGRGDDVASQVAGDVLVDEFEPLRQRGPVRALATNGVPIRVDTHEQQRLVPGHALPYKAASARFLGELVVTVCTLITLDNDANAVRYGEHGMREEGEVGEDMRRGAVVPLDVETVVLSKAPSESLEQLSAGALFAASI